MSCHPGGDEPASWLEGVATDFCSRAWVNFQEMPGPDGDVEEERYGDTAPFFGT